MQDVQNQPEEQKQVAEEENQQPPEDVEMTFGYPNSILLENDIDPQMLDMLPEEIRVEILSSI